MPPWMNTSTGSTAFAQLARTSSSVHSLASTTRSDPLFLPETDRGCVGRGMLGGDMDLQGGSQLFHPAGDRWRSDDQRMHTGIGQCAHIVIEAAEIVFMRQHIDRHMHFFPVFPRKSSAFADILQGEIAGTGYAGKPCLSADVDRICPIQAARSSAV